MWVSLWDMISIIIFDFDFEIMVLGLGLVFGYSLMFCFLKYEVLIYSFGKIFYFLE